MWVIDSRNVNFIHNSLSFNSETPLSQSKSSKCLEMYIPKHASKVLFNSQDEQFQSIDSSRMFLFRELQVPRCKRMTVIGEEVEMLPIQMGFFFFLFLSAVLWQECIHPPGPASLPSPRGSTTKDQNMFSISRGNIASFNFSSIYIRSSEPRSTQKAKLWYSSICT